MAFTTRRLLFTYEDPDINESPPLFPPLTQPPESQPPSPPPLQYQQLPIPPPLNHSSFPRQLLLIGVVICAFLIFAVVFTTVAGYFIRRQNSRRTNRRNPRNPPVFFDTRQEFRFLDEDHGPQLDHPIWHIRTVGLDQSAIDSIALFRYKKGEGIIDGADCSVCLTEFEEDETLRLLPKCSHAFHVPCIDTWLRSHKNCPLCRAPVTPVVADADSSAGESDLSRVSGSSSEILPPDLEEAEARDLTDAGDSQLVAGGDELALQGVMDLNSESRVSIGGSSRFYRVMKSFSFGSSSKEQAPLKRSSSSSK